MKVVALNGSPEARSNNFDVYIQNLSEFAPRVTATSFYGFPAGSNTGTLIVKVVQSLGAGRNQVAHRGSPL